MKYLVDMKIIEQMSVVKSLLSSSNPTIQYKARKLLLDEPEDSSKILQSKRLPDGGFPLELKNCKTSNTIITRGSFADWGESVKKKMNPFVTVYALYVLKCAGKLA